MKISVCNVAFGSPQKLRFAVISDLHAKVAPRLAELTLEQSPDAVLMPGDIFDTRGCRDDAVRLISQLASELPVFCSLGNHDRDITDGDRRDIERSGACLLDNSAVTWRGIRIGGLTSGFFTEYRSDIEKTPSPDLGWLAAFDREPSPRILLCHHPEYYPDYIRRTGIELTVSGHAHGGQWNIFGRGVFAPGQGLFPKYTAGCYDDGRLVVSRGVTNTIKIPRFFNPTEIVVINTQG